MNDLAVKELLENLRESFLAEMPSRIDDIEREVMALPETDEHEELFRLVHSLKGSAGTHSLHGITKIAHDMEEVMLSLMKQGQLASEATRKILLEYIDIFRDTTASLQETDSNALDMDEWLTRLRQSVLEDKLQVLVVEPSRLYAGMIAYNLEGLAANITYVEDGLPALEHLLLNHYDVLICSMECPRLNGDALLAALRLAHSPNRDIKAILVTSRDAGQIRNHDDFNVILARHGLREGKLKDEIEQIIKSK